MGKTVAAIVGVVAAIGIAIAAPYLAPLALHALGIAASTTAIAIATAVISIGLGLAVSLAFKALGVGAPSAKNAVGPPQVFRQSISNSFIVYALRRCGGLMVFFHAKQSGGVHYRYFAIAVAGHRCQGVSQWRLGDTVVSVDGSGMVTSGPYANNAWLFFQRGLAAETANATFVAECDGKWTTAHKGNGVAAIYAKFKMVDAVIQAGLPNITADIEGRDDIFDTRDGVAKYTANGALVFFDWMAMLREEGGFGAYADEIPDDDWISAQANVCDETVGGEARYELAGVIQTGAAPSEVRDALVVNMAGKYIYSQGKHLMRPGYWVPSSGTLAEDDLAGPIKISPFLTGDVAATEVTGTFIDPSTGYQGGALTTWDRPGAADVQQVDVDLAFITSLNRGNRILAIMGKRAACEKTVTWPMNIAGLKVRAMDTWTLGSARYGIDNYAWVVGNWQLGADPDGGPSIVLSVAEENPEVYDDPAPAVPSSPPAISKPTVPLLTSSAITALILDSGITGLTLTVTVPAGGNTQVTISDHDRVYTDRAPVPVDGNAGPVAVPAASGDLLLAYYDDPDLTGGAVIYHYVVLAGGAGDASVAFATPANPYRHNVISMPVPATGGATTGGSDAGSGGGSGGSGGGWNRLSDI